MRFYTLEEARALLPRVIPVLEELRASFIALRALQSAIAAESRGASADGQLLGDAFARHDGENRVEKLNRSLRAAARGLEAWGIEVKDPERGLIDFYAQRDGAVVFLCFELGEETIRHWHGLREGYAGRRPIE